MSLSTQRIIKWGPRRRSATFARPALQILESRLTPVTITVQNANDSGPGSLRQAILDTNVMAGPDTIVFNPAFFATPRTIAMSFALGEMRISDDLTITGPGSANLTIDAGIHSPEPRIFTVLKPGLNAIANVTISNMTLTHGGGNTGGASPVDGDGGAISVQDENLTLQNMVFNQNVTAIGHKGGGIATTSSASLTIRNCTFFSNGSAEGGAIYFFNKGSLLLENSTLSSNYAGGGGGGISFSGDVLPGGFVIRNCTFAGNFTSGGSGGAILFPLFIVPAGVTAAIQNSTITNNTSFTLSAAVGAGGGGIAIPAARTDSILRLQSTIISGNIADSGNGSDDISAKPDAVITATNCAIGDPDGFMLSSSSSGNLPFGAALHLFPLASYGGSTQTLPFGIGSPALDAGSNPAGLPFDQRGTGFLRQLGPQVDIGAVEGVRDFPTAEVSGLVSVSASGSNDPYSLSVTYSGVTPINTATLDNNDIRITGPNGFNVLATRGTINASNPQIVSVNYSFTAPANPTPGWDVGDNGFYTLALEANQVANTNNVFIPAGELGMFHVFIGQDFVVTNLNDSGAGSLRQAIQDANSLDSPDTITFQPGLTGTITLTSGELQIIQSVTIIGPGATVLSVNGGGTSRVFDVRNIFDKISVSILGLTVTGGNGRTGGTFDFGNGGGIFTSEDLTLDGMVITNNLAVLGGGGGIAVSAGNNIVICNSTISGNTAQRLGGGLYFANGGSLFLENSTISGNRTFNSGMTVYSGGGICFDGTVSSPGFTLRNSTISGNSAAFGGGICFLDLNTTNAPILVQSCTIANNSSATPSTAAGAGGGGIGLPMVSTANGATAVVSLQSTIVSGNTSNSANGRDDIASVSAGVFNVNYSAIGDPDGFTLSGTSGNNLPFGAALNLQPLASNGGPTQTRSLGPGSLAIDAGPTTVPGLPFDQRGSGFARVFGPRADIGAFEVQPPTVTNISVNGGAAQRSRVTTLAVTFSNQVTFAGPVANAFTLVRTGGGAVSFTATANVVGGVTVVTIDNFTGTEAQFGSLRDGRFTLTVLANQISAGGVNMTSNVTFGEAQGLFRFYGDVNGDRHVDVADFGLFSSTFNLSTGQTGFLAAFDFNNDGHIDILDFGQFSLRFFTPLP